MATYASIKYNFTPPAATTSAQVGGGAMVLIKSIDSDGSDATISFVDGTSDVVLDNTYKTYLFTFNNIHPETDNTILKFNGSSDTGSNYNVTKTTTSFDAFHSEADDATLLHYNTSHDVGQGTGVQTLLRDIGNANDESASGYLYIFNPSSTTFVKHFLSQGSSYQHQDININQFNAGYFNTTSVIDAIQFSMSADEIQGGTIKLYGIA